MEKVKTDEPLEQM